MFFRSSVAVAAAAVAVSASPVQNEGRTIHVQLTHHSNVTSIKDLVTSGQKRLAEINNSPDGNSFASSGAVTNVDVSYLAPVVIGGKTYQLIVDTGSSNTWCGAGAQCEPSSTGRSTGRSVSVSYGSGSFSGTQYLDRVSFAGLTVNSQGVGSASRSTGFQGVDGIFGVGPVALTQNTVSGQSTVPTFLDNLYSQNSISPEVLGVYFKPLTGSSTSSTNGQLTLGGTDSTKYTGSISYTPKATTGAAAPYWGISSFTFSYGSTSLGTSSAGIIDTGTTLIYIASGAYNNFLSATGGTTSGGLASFSTRPTQNFVIRIGTVTVTLTPTQYLVPQAQYSYFGLSSGRYYAWITNGGSSGVNTIIGQKFLENYYSVFDTTNARIGFAPRT